MAKRKVSKNLNSGNGCDCFLCRMGRRRNERKKLKELMEKKIDSLSLVEKNAYEEIMARNDSGMNLSLLTTPFMAIFYLGVFGIVLLLAFQINVLGPLRTIGFLFAQMFWIFFLLWVVITITNLINLKSLRRKLLLGVRK